MQDPVYYLYGLSSSSDLDNIRYIGYAKEPKERLAEHLRDVNRLNVKTYKKYWLRKEILNNE